MGDWCIPPQIDPDELEPVPDDSETMVCDESCDRFGGVEPCRCYGTHEETTEGGW